MVDFFSPTYACPNELCDEAGYLVSSSGSDVICRECGSVMEKVDVEVMVAEGMDVTVRKEST